MDGCTQKYAAPVSELAEAAAVHAREREEVGAAEAEEEDEEAAFFSFFR